MAVEGADDVSARVIGAAIEVHRHLGPGLLESAYARCLEQELRLRGVPFVSEVPVPVIYKGIVLDCGYRVDLIVGATSPVTASPVTTSPVTVSPVTASPVTTSPVATSPVATSPVATTRGAVPTGTQVVVELKCVSQIEPIHLAQLLTYLRLTGRRVGLVMNFNVPLLKDGIRRVLL